MESGCWGKEESVFGWWRGNMYEEKSLEEWTGGGVPAKRRLNHHQSGAKK